MIKKASFMSRMRKAKAGTEWLGFREKLKNRQPFFTKNIAVTHHFLIGIFAFYFKKN